MSCQSELRVYLPTVPPFSWDKLTQKDKKHFTDLFMAFSLCVLWTVLFAAFNHLPEVPDHHADPGPGSAAVCCASVPFSWGITHKTPGSEFYPEEQQSQTISEEQHWLTYSLNTYSLILWFDLSTERFTGYPAFAQLLRSQSAPADRPVGLQGAQQGLFTASYLAPQKHN